MKFIFVLSLFVSVPAFAQVQFVPMQIPQYQAAPQYMINSAAPHVDYAPIYVPPAPVPVTNETHTGSCMPNGNGGFSCISN